MLKTEMGQIMFTFQYEHVPDSIIYIPFQLETHHFDLFWSDLFSN